MQNILKKLLIVSLIGAIVPGTAACAGNQERVGTQTKVVESSSAQESIAESAETTASVESASELSGEQEVSEYDSRILEAYHHATDMSGWFRIGTIDCIVMDDYIEKDGIVYYRVKDYATLDELREKLCEAFTEEYACRLIEESYIEYVELDNVLYAVVADRGTDIYAGEEAYHVDGNDQGGILTVTVQLLSKDDTGKVEGCKDYEFPYIIQEESVLFTDFPQVR